MLLQNKVTIITGATRGIGKGILQRFAEEGATVIGVYSSSDQTAQEIEAECAAKGQTVRFYKGSIADRDFITNLYRDVHAKYGRIDVLVNNAGIVRDNFISQMSDEDWDAVYQTNFLGTYTCSTEVVPYMLEQGAGKVVNVVSVTGVLGREAQSNYGASKGSIIGLTRLMARKYAQSGLHFNAVAPGMINTEMIGHVPAKKLENFLKHTNVNRLGETEEIANAVLFLSTELSNYFSANVLKVDGGFLR